MFGIIGGTGLYSIEGLDVIEKKEVKTPFGAPSAPIVIGKFGENKVAFLPRHGLHHEHLPSEINFKANIWALKSVGVRSIISVSATGSLVREIAPGDLALPDQYLDFTKGKRDHTFFGKGLVAHISTAEPACKSLIGYLKDCADKAGVKIHSEKAYACVEGPRLGTRVESFFWKTAKCDLVGMTNVPECFLAKEAQLAYATVAVATDYDCWLDDPEEHVTLDKVMQRYKASLDSVKSILKTAVQSSYDHSKSGHRKSLQDAVLTAESALKPAQKELLAFLRE